MLIGGALSLSATAAGIMAKGMKQSILHTSGIVTIGAAVITTSILIFNGLTASPEQTMSDTSVNTPLSVTAKVPEEPEQREENKEVNEEALVSVLSSTPVAVELATANKVSEATPIIVNGNVNNNNSPPLLPENIDNPTVPQEPKDIELPTEPDKESHGCVYPNMCLKCIFSKDDAKLLEALSADSVANPSIEFTELLSRYQFYFIALK